MVNIFWGNEIISYITKFTYNRTISEWIWIILIAMRGFIIYNSVFSGRNLKKIINNYMDNIKDTN